VLGRLDLPPRGEVMQDRDVRNRPVVAASGAIRVSSSRFDEPVASIERRICAEAIELATRGERSPYAVLRLQRRQDRSLRDVAELARTRHADVVLEVKNLSAVLALE
jgi:hypothetical protein